MGIANAIFTSLVTDLVNPNTFVINKLRNLAQNDH